MYRRVILTRAYALLIILMVFVPAARAQEAASAAPGAAGDLSRGKAEQLCQEADRLNALGKADTRRAAIEKYLAALPQWRAAADRLNEARTLGKLGTAYSDIGENQTAQDCYKQALTIFRELGERAAMVTMLSNIGVTYRLLGDSLTAQEYFNEALSARMEMGDKEGAAETLNQLAMASSHVGEKLRALEYHERALEIRRELKNPVQLGATLLNMSVEYIGIGEIQKALDLLQQALAIDRANNNFRREAYALTSMGTAYWALGDYESALDYFQQAVPKLQSAGDRRGEATPLNHIGVVYHALGELDKAADYLDRSLKLRRATGDLRGESYTLNNIGLVYEARGESDKALEYFEKALELRRKVGDRKGEGHTLDCIGQHYYNVGNREKARDYYHQALALRADIHDPLGQVVTHYNIARVARDLDNLAEARVHIDKAISLSESVRASVAIQELRQSYFSVLRDYYELSTDLYMAMHRREPQAGYDIAAFSESERARARTLLELLAEARVDIKEGIDSDLIERERRVQRHLNEKIERLARIKSAKGRESQLEAAEKELRALTNELEQVRSEIRRQSPRYATLTQSRPLTLTEIQRQLLDNDTVLLEFLLGEARSYLWVVTRDGLTSYQLPGRAEIERAASKVYELLVARVRNQAAQAEYEQAATRLSQMLLSAAADNLRHKRLLIVADGVLQFIPFAALPQPDTRSNKSFTPLVAAHEIVTLPSASTLAAIRAETPTRANDRKTIALIADPVFSLDDKRLGGSEGSENQLAVNRINRGLTRSITESAASGEEMRLPRLLSTRDEAQAIADLVAADARKVALGFDASRAAIASPELEKYQVIHIATHGLLNSKHPELSGIVLSLFDAQGQPQNGFLRLHDIYNLRLPVDLVVLSACQTGLGKKVKGEGLIGLTRGFMYAGAARVMASLWKVDDEATAELMKRFYENLFKGGQRPAQALRTAQLSMAKERRWQSPYYWAGFVLQGEW